LRVAVVVAVAELLPPFGSLVLLDAVAVFVMIVPSRVLALTATTIVKVAEAPEARLAVVQVIVPVRAPLLLGGLVQLQPAAPEFETNFVLIGTVSLKLTSVALDGPLLATITV
jgi:hypothetical protein